MSPIRPKPKLAFALGLSLLCIAGFCMVALLVNKQMIASLDAALIRLIQGAERPEITVLMKAFTFIGSTAVVVPLVLLASFVLYAKLHRRLELLLLAVILLGSLLLNTALKLLFQRERPTLHRLIQETGYSFPSGHSMQAFALYAALAFLLWKHIGSRGGRVAVVLFCIGMVVMIGLSRIYLGVHYPSDVVGAYLASGFWFALSVWVFQWYKEYQYEQKRHQGRDHKRQA